MSRSTGSTRTAVMLFAATVICGGVIAGWTWPALQRSRALSIARRSAASHAPLEVQSALAGLIGERGDPEASLLLAAASRRLGESEEAKRLVTAARQAGALPELVDLEEMLQAVRGTGLGSDSAKLLRFMLSTHHPESAQIYEGLFDAAVASFAMTEAHALVSEWIDRFPNDWYPRELRGGLRARFHLGTQAAEDYRAALRLRPDAGECMAGLADVLVWQLGRAEEAEPILRGLLDRGAATSRSLVALAEALRRMGRITEAVEFAERALALEPDEPSALRIVAAVDLEEGRASAAVANLERADRVSPGDIETVSALARALAAVGREEESSVVQERGVRLRELAESLDPLLESILEDPADASVRLRISETMQKMGRLTDARNWLESAIAIDPDSESIARLRELDQAIEENGVRLPVDRFPGQIRHQSDRD